MNDPVSDRLRSYYVSIQRDPPPRLERSVIRAMETTPQKRGPSFTSVAFALIVAGAVLIALVVAVRGLVPSPSPSASPVVGSSASAIPTVAPTPSPTPTVPATLPPTPLMSATPEPPPTARPMGTLQGTGAMNPALSGPAAVRLSDGRVLLTGGRQKNAGGITMLRSQAAEIYSAGPGTFTPTGSMNDARAGHTATLLNDGRVLVVGGIDASDGYDNLATAELYDPGTGKFTRTGSLAQGRARHTATLLDDGRVLIAGGYGGGTLSLKSVEIYDPATGKFAAAGSMMVARRDATATLLSDGRVLIAGGLDENATAALAAAEIYDPATGKFTATGSMATARYAFAAQGLEDGRVLIAGGTSTAPSSAAVSTAELYDPDTGKFSPAGSLSAAGAFTAVWLKDTRILFVSGGALAIYDPSTGAFTNVPTGIHIPEVQYQTATWTDSNVLLTEGGPAQVYGP